MLSIWVLFLVPLSQPCSSTAFPFTDQLRFLTQQLFWDQNARKVYSDSFIHIERAEQIIEGVGFKSNERMTIYELDKPMGIFPVSTLMRKDTTNTETNNQ